MKDKLKQVVIQKDNRMGDRALVQYGEGLLDESQNITNYVDLTDEEKEIWVSFVDMITKK